MASLSGIIIEEMELKGTRAGDRASGGEMVPGGVSRSFDVPEMAEDITPERVEEFIDEASEMVDLVGEEYELSYYLTVRAPSPLGAKGKARAFARMKNPFEASMVEISDPDLDESMSRQGLARYYSVEATVFKS